MLREDQLYKIKAKSQYDDENDTWKIPGFILRKNELNFPKLPEMKIKKMIEDNLDQELVIDDTMKVHKGKGPSSLAESRGSSQKSSKEQGWIPFHDWENMYNAANDDDMMNELHQA